MAYSQRTPKSKSNRPAFPVYQSRDDRGEYDGAVKSYTGNRNKPSSLPTTPTTSNRPAYYPLTPNVTGNNYRSPGTDQVSAEARDLLLSTLKAERNRRRSNNSNYQQENYDTTMPYANEGYYPNPGKPYADDSSDEEERKKREKKEFNDKIRFGFQLLEVGAAVGAGALTALTEKKSDRKPDEERPETSQYPTSPLVPLTSLMFGIPPPNPAVLNRNLALGPYGGLHAAANAFTKWMMQDKDD